MQTPAIVRSQRYPLPGMVAYHWTGGKAHGCEIGDISISGIFLVTDERWFVGTVMLMNLQRPVAPGEKPDLPPEEPQVPAYQPAAGAAHLAETYPDPVSDSGPGQAPDPNPAPRPVVADSVPLLARVVRFDAEGVGLAFVFEEKDPEIKESPVHPEGGSDQEALVNFLVHQKVMPPPPPPEEKTATTKTSDKS